MKYRRIESLAFASMPRVEARGVMARGERGVARRAKPGGFGVVPLGFATDASLYGAELHFYHITQKKSAKSLPYLAKFR
jgi:hypothetical protein